MSYWALLCTCVSMMAQASPKELCIAGIPQLDRQIHCAERAMRFTHVRHVTASIAWVYPCKQGPVDDDGAWLQALFKKKDVLAYPSCLPFLFLQVYTPEI